jgi:hypothetical protein
MNKAAASDTDVKGKANDLEKALEGAPGVYEVMRLYEQYQRVLDQARAYLVDRSSQQFPSFSSSDRTG